MAMMLVGFERKITESRTQHGQPRFIWNVARFGRVLANGVEDSHKDAEKASRVMAHKLMTEQEVGSETRKKHKLKIKYRLKTRPYLVEGVCQFIINSKGTDKISVMDQADYWEKSCWEKDPPKYRKPLSSHHLAVTPMQGAGGLWDDFVGAGLIKVNEDGMCIEWGKLRTWAHAMFGTERGF